MPFSNEALVRAAAAARTPLVSAIGHETDNPLLDLVADYRASTPTDAAKRIVPDAAAERALIAQCRTRALASVRAVIEHNQAGLDAARSRPVLANPQRIIENAATQTAELTGRAHRALELVATRHSARIDQLTATLRALSPAATLDRGYAIIARADGAIVRSSSQVATGDVIVARLASGRLTAKVAATAPDRKARASASPAE